jgi:hypothetical protein
VVARAFILFGNIMEDLTTAINGLSTLIETILVPLLIIWGFSCGYK